MLNQCKSNNKIMSGSVTQESKELKITFKGINNRLAQPMSSLACRRKGTKEKEEETCKGYYLFWPLSWME